MAKSRIKRSKPRKRTRRKLPQTPQLNIVKLRLKHKRKFVEVPVLVSAQHVDPLADAVPVVEVGPMVTAWRTIKDFFLA
jgi:hypothetical protein